MPLNWNTTQHFTAWSSARRKETTKTVVQGFITEYGSKIPLEGARIYLWCYNDKTFAPEGVTLIDSITTNAEGYFHAEYANHEVCDSLNLSVSKEGFFEKNNIRVHPGMNELNIMLDSEAWVRFVTMPGQGFCHLGIVLDSFEENRLDFYSVNGIQERIVKTNDYVLKNIAFSPCGAIDNTCNDLINVPGHDTITYTLYY